MKKKRSIWSVEYKMGTNDTNMRTFFTTFIGDPNEDLNIIKKRNMEIIHKLLREVFNKKTIETAMENKKFRFENLTWITDLGKTTYELK